MNRTDKQNYNYVAMRSFLTAIGDTYKESTEQYCKRLDVIR